MENIAMFAVSTTCSIVVTVLAFRVKLENRLTKLEEQIKRISSIENKLDLLSSSLGVRNEAS